MKKLEINSFEEFEGYIGKEIGVSDYIRITQEQINLFADATLDHQWIHVDAKRAEEESPYKSTIAHGYLNLSIIPHLWGEILEVNNIKLLVNYGIEKLRFSQPVLVNNEVRLKAKLNSIVDLRGTAKAEVKATLEIKDNKKRLWKPPWCFYITLYNNSAYILKGALSAKLITPLLGITGLCEHTNNEGIGLVCKKLCIFDHL